MESKYYYTRSTYEKDLVNDNQDVINLVKLDDGKLVTPDNEFMMQSHHDFKVHSVNDDINMDESDKYFVEIAWHDRYQNAWFSAILVPTTWDDVLKCQELCEGGVYMSKEPPRDTLKFKELYALSVNENNRLVRYNVDDVKISLETGAEHVYITRGINSGILMSRKYENMINKNELDDSLVWISGWKLDNYSKLYLDCVKSSKRVKSSKHHLNMYK
jgi:hypothetical protein